MNLFSKINLYFILLMITLNSAWGFTCYVTFVKDNCWLNYDVTISLRDNVSSQTLIELTAPEGQSWIRGSFECQEKQVITYFAQFSPIFWQQDQGKTYAAESNVILPDTIHPGDTAWTINICYSQQFTGVPLPPEATNNCQCDFSKIPSIPPKQILNSPSSS